MIPHRCCCLSPGFSFVVKKSNAPKERLFSQAYLFLSYLFFFLLEV